MPRRAPRHELSTDNNSTRAQAFHKLLYPFGKPKAHIKRSRVPDQFPGREHRDIVRYETPLCMSAITTADGAGVCAYAGVARESIYLLDRSWDKHGWQSESQVNDEMPIIAELEDCNRSKLIHPPPCRWRLRPARPTRRRLQFHAHERWGRQGKKADAEE
jgi:hypothetical protein